MPQSCSKCPCYDCEYDMYNLTQRCFRTIVDGLALRERAYDCPLVESRCASWEESDADDDGTLRCSKCKAVLEEYMYGWHNFYFCYHCGAPMSNPYPSSWRRVRAERKAAAAVSDDTASLADQIAADIEYAAQHDIELPGEAYLLRAILETNNALENALQAQKEKKQGRGTEIKEDDNVLDDDTGSN